MTGKLLPYHAPTTILKWALIISCVGVWICQKDLCRSRSGESRSWLDLHQGDPDGSPAQICARLTSSARTTSSLGASPAIGSAAPEGPTVRLPRARAPGDTGLAPSGLARAGLAGPTSCTNDPVLLIVMPGVVRTRRTERLEPLLPRGKAPPLGMLPL
eukprot:CAMPEP_0202924780 /NCGR_PEP_ID=MMETSP1392-20130828/79157_1 /ASSEMBLY_ACC=CAM_ASM_000868 /TAXON_ID=225041 /ORGANISM="Chlamydomonas chlamydogama, Strain SAG 11-48b" /LENGTH=157 /DNA_ID=CAMNT_0049618535 /DNA_START=2000 /DNA_END=2473 /DNA_ORIENTATION=+